MVCVVSHKPWGIVTVRSWVGGGMNERERICGWPACVRKCVFVCVCVCVCERERERECMVWLAIIH